MTTRLPPLTAVILAGGRGERLYPVTQAIPKPLVPIGGRPILDHLMGFLAGEGVARFVLCTGYLAEQVDAFAASLRATLPDIMCVDSGADAAMSDRLRDAAPHARGLALVCYGDTLANVDLRALLATYHAMGRDDGATVTVHRLVSPFGIVDVDEGGYVTGFREKPPLPYWINVGFIVCAPAVLAAARPGSDLADLLDGLAGRGRLTAHRHEGSHVTVNTERERRDAERAIARVFTLADQAYT